MIASSDAELLIFVNEQFTIFSMGSSNVETEYMTPPSYNAVLFVKLPIMDNDR